VIRSIRTLAATLFAVHAALSAPVLVSAQGTKPAPKPAAPQPAAGTTKPRPAAPAPQAPQARRIVRTDTVNETTVTEFNDSRRVAIVAAVGRYDDPALAPLRFTVADAVELSAELKRQGYVVHTLLNSEATNDNIRERIESVAAGGDAPGTVLFAFAGHGFQSAKGVNYLATFSTTIETLEQRGLSVPDVQALMKATGAKRSVLLIDACRNVPGTRAVGTPTTTFRDLEKSEGIRTLMSTRPGGFSYEDQALQHGIFTHYVIEGLRGKAANTDSKVTFEDLASYVERRVETYAAEKDLSQKPFRSVDASGDFLLSVATPLKEEEVVKVRDESGGKDMPNNAVSVARVGVTMFDGYVMVAEDAGVRLYRSPGMQLYADLKPDMETKNVPDGWKRYIGKAGAADEVVHAVVRFQGGFPAELKGRLGAKCEANCKGQDLKIYEGESLSAAGVAGAVGKAAGVVGRIPGFGRNRTQDAANKTKGVAEGTQAALLLMDGRSWTKFDLAPRLDLRSR